jgi:hypothetical protein
MNKAILSFVFATLIISSVFAAEPFRDPFVVLKVNGVTYQPDSRIEVRAGEKILVEAVLMGGRRDYCMDPQTYANIGKNTVVETQGENGMSFNVNSGQFRGKWSLVSEIASFSSADGVKITAEPEKNGMARIATVEVDAHKYSEVFLRVNSTTNWHYVRNTPGGQTEENETYDGSDLFTLVITKEEGVWFSSNNISAKGMEDFSVRNNLHDIQRFYDLAEKCLLDKNISCADMHLKNIETVISDLNTSIDRAKKNDPAYECEITFIGVPSDIPMEHLNKIYSASQQWRDMWSISHDNAQQINEMLLNTQMTFSANILRSVFKNYIDWGSGLPTGFMDIVTKHDPKGLFAGLSLPTKLLDFYSTSLNDAGILKDQANTIKILTELQSFYENRRDASLNELKELNRIVSELRPIEDFHKKALSVMQRQSPHKWKSK